MLFALVVPKDDGDSFLERELRKTLELEECGRFFTEVKTFHAWINKTHAHTDQED